jgi:hypothetical protein
MTDLAALNPDVTATCRYCEEEFEYTPVKIRKLSAAAPRQTKNGRTVRNVCDKCRADPKRVAKIKRYGVAAKDAPSMGDMTRWQTEQDRIYNIKYKMMMVPSHDHTRISGSAWEMGRPMAGAECEHGRLPGDVCPSPRVEFTSIPFAGTVVQNWPHDHPCDCWGE